MKNFFAYLVYLVAFSFMKILGIFPRSFLIALSRFIGNILYLIPSCGHLCYVNICAAFPEKTPKEAKKIAKESLQNLILTCLEFLWIRNNPEELENLVDHSAADEIAEEGLKKVKEGKETILVTPHLGNWEFSGRILAQIYHFQMATVVRTSRNIYLDKLISGGRNACGNVEIIYAKGGAKAMKNALRRGKTLGILIDQNVRLREGGIFIEMFGLPIPVSRAPAVLGRTHNTFFAVGATLRQPDGSFRAFLKTLPKETKEYESDEELIQALTDLSEELIRMAPEQYLWLYKRFQYIPEGTPEDKVKRFPEYAVRPNARFYSKNPDVAARRKEQ